MVNVPINSPKQTIVNITAIIAAVGTDSASFYPSDHLLESLVVFGFGESPIGLGRHITWMLYLSFWLPHVMLAVGFHESEAFEGHTAKKMLESVHCQCGLSQRVYV